MKTYVTFGLEHTHSVNGKTFDKDCVAVIECYDMQHGRKLAFSFFGSKFCFEFHEEEFNHINISFYPRGLIPVNFGEQNAET